MRNWRIMSAWILAGARVVAWSIRQLKGVSQIRKLDRDIHHDMHRDRPHVTTVAVTYFYIPTANHCIEMRARVIIVATVHWRTDAAA